MDCAFSMESCKQGISIKYVRLPDLLIDINIAKNAGNFAKILNNYTKPKLLILDEWLLMRLNENESKNIFELIHKRRCKSSTIFYSQFRESEWYNRICTTDSIMDRISYDSYKTNIERINPKRNLSMLKVYGLDLKLTEYI